MKKKLVDYLAAYLEHEIELHGNMDVVDNFDTYIDNGLEAFESTEQMVVDVRPECPLDTITDNALEDEE